jgi:hypothetical protein
MSVEIQFTFDQAAVVKSWGRRIALSKFCVASVHDAKRQGLGAME